MTRPLCVLALLGGLLPAAWTNASLVTFELVDPDPAGGSTTAGELFEGGALTVTQSGLTLGLGVTTTLGDGTGVYTAVPANSGVDTDGLSGANGDGPAEIDAGETVTFTPTSSGLLVTLTQIDFSGVGDSAADAALVTIANGPQQTLFKGLAGFDASSVWTPASPIGLASGDTIAITASASLGLQSITFDVSAIPEPSTTVLVSLFGLMSLGWRRRH